MGGEQRAPILCALHQPGRTGTTNLEQRELTRVLHCLKLHASEKYVIGLCKPQVQT